MKKGYKTTIVAIIGAVLGITIFGFWIAGKVDNIGLGIGLGGVSSFTATIGLLLSKDYDKSHTNSKN